RGEFWAWAGSHFFQFRWAKGMSGNDTDLLKAGLQDEIKIRLLLHSTPNTSCPSRLETRLHLVSRLFGIVDIRNGKPPAGVENAKSLAIYRFLVRAKIDDAIGDDGIGKVIRQI